MQNKILQVHRGILLAGALGILYQWLVSRWIWKLASSHSAHIMYTQRLGTVFRKGSSCRNSVKVPQINVFTLQRQKSAGGIMIFTAKFKNFAITSSQILELGFSLEDIYSKPSQDVTSTTLKPVSDFEALAEIYLWEKYIFHSMPQKPGLFSISWAQILTSGNRKHDLCIPWHQSDKDNNVAFMQRTHQSWGDAQHFLSSSCFLCVHAVHF